MLCAGGAPVALIREAPFPLFDKGDEDVRNHAELRAFLEPFL